MAKSPPPSNIMALVSPPDEHMDDFNCSSSPALKPAQPMSTPTSTATKIPPTAMLPSPESPAWATFDLPGKFLNWQPGGEHVNPDPILYPRQRQESMEHKSLFDDRRQSFSSLKSPPPFLQPDQHPITSPIILPKPIGVKEHILVTKEEALKNSLIDNHYNYIVPKSKASSQSTPRMIQIPKRSEYRLMLDCVPSFKSIVIRDYNSNPKEYLKRQREENKEMQDHINKKSLPVKKQPTLKPRHKKTQSDDSILHSVTPAARVRKPAKKQDDRSSTPEVKHRRTAVKKTKAEFSIDDIPDYTPDWSTIPLGKVFNVSWNGQPLRLSEDPMRGDLHPAELDLASKLRLPCEQYLKTKRRVFVGRVNNLIKHPNKQFCKTDAQQVGGVDVNKLSQLWQAYDSIGWFKASHFQKHADAVREAAQVYDPKNTKWVDRKELLGF